MFNFPHAFSSESHPNTAQGRRTLRQVGMEQGLRKGTTDIQAGAAETVAFKQHHLPLDTYTGEEDKCLSCQAEHVCHLLSVLNHSLSMTNYPPQSNVHY